MRVVLLMFAVAGIVTSWGRSLAAQTTATSDRQLFASREQLRHEATIADSAALAARTTSVRERSRYESALLARRLAEGDFAAGDQIVLNVEGHAALTDTFTVRAARQLPLPDLPAADLSGVLRSELQSHLAAHIARYVRTPRIQATPLIRVAVFGSVGRPGFYAVPADMLLSDAIMRAGGPTPEADVARTEIRRAAATIWDSGQLQIAITDGYTLDQLHLQAGDQVLVGERRRRNWSGILQVLTLTLGAAATVFTLSR